MSFHPFLAGNFESVDCRADEIAAMHNPNGLVQKPIIALDVDMNIIQKSGSWFSYGETRLGQGRDAVKSIIADNPELMEELEQKIKDALAPSGEVELAEQD